MDLEQRLLVTDGGVLLDRVEHQRVVHLGDDFDLGDAGVLDRLGLRLLDDLTALDDDFAGGGVDNVSHGVLAADACEGPGCAFAIRRQRSQFESMSRSLDAILELGEVFDWV